MANISPIPPVHQNCRCTIGPDGVWTDAGDARVCLYCMTLGASWNLRLEQPLPEQEAAIDELLDKQGRTEFRKAIEKDSVVADAVIRDAAAASEAGLLADISTSGGEALTVRVEREATRRLAQARAGAAIPPGRDIPGLGQTVEGLIFETLPGGRKKPVMLSVLIAQTGGHKVIRRAGRYYVQTTGGRTVASDDTLGLALLILLALAERERQKREERRKEQEAAR